MNRLEQLTAFHKENPEDPFIRYCIALEHVKSGSLSDAEEWFKDLTESHPAYVATYYHYGKLLENMKEKDQAISAYEKGMQVARESGDHHALSELMNARNELVNDFDVEFDD